MEHHIPECPKVKAQLQKEAKLLGEKLPGPERSSRHRNQQVDQRPTTETSKDDDLDATCVSGLDENNG